MTWIREGYCCKCGDCCAGNPFTGENVGMCPKLNDEKDGMRTCSVHGTDNFYWNIACKLWPTIPEHTAPYSRCTFTWRWQP